MDMGTSISWWGIMKIREDQAWDVQDQQSAFLPNPDPFLGQAALHRLPRFAPTKELAQIQEAP